MATVQGMTPEEILENIADVVVSGEITGGNLILTTKAGDSFVVGPVGGGGGSSYPPGSSVDPIADTTDKVWSPQALNGFIDTNAPVLSVNGQTGAIALRLDQLVVPAASVDMANQGIINLAEPTNSTDAATKNYVDLALQGLSPKAPVRVATTANITLSGPQTIDGISVVAGDRVLVKDQTSAAQNGIYVCAAGSWARSSDANSWNELISAYVFVQVGGQQDNGYLCTVDAGGTIGTTAVTWVQFTGAGQITAGSGLTKSGNTISIVTAGIISTHISALAVTTTKIDNLAVTNGKIADNAITSSKMATGSVVLDSTTTTGTLPVAKGGTGATDAYGARYTLGTVGTRTGLVPALTANTWASLAVNALMYTQGYIVHFVDATTNEDAYLDYRSTATGSLEVRSNVAVAANVIRYIIIAIGE